MSNTDDDLYYIILAREVVDGLAPSDLPFKSKQSYVCAVERLFIKCGPQSTVDLLKVVPRRQEMDKNLFGPYISPGFAKLNKIDEQASNDLLLLAELVDSSLMETNSALDFLVGKVMRYGINWDKRSKLPPKQKPKHDWAKARYEATKLLEQNPSLLKNRSQHAKQTIRRLNWDSGESELRKNKLPVWFPKK
ncbi:hypothetical protein ACFL17_06260 [Pseudomonadota bacterium]